MQLQSIFPTLRLPIIAAPMFLVSGVRLVASQCNAGIVGTFPALNARTSAEFSEWLDEIKTLIGDRPFGVNLIAAATNKRLEADLSICVEHKVPLVITSLRAPEGMSNAIAAYGGVHMHDVITVRHAEKALEGGVHGLILVCAGAGGHGGQLSPMAFLPEVRRFYTGPLALGGAVATGRSLLAARALGADFGYIGTRFIATDESLANADYCEMVVNAAAGNITYTPYFSGVGANYLTESIHRAGIDPDTIPKGALLPKDQKKPDHVRAWSDILGCGQGAGATTSVQSVEAVISEIEAEYWESRGKI